MYDIFAWKFPIGRIFGTTVYVHILFLLVLVPLIIRFSFGQNVVPGTWVDVCLFAILVWVSILAHEMGHVFATRWVGGEADEVMLWPLGGVAEVSYLPSTPWAHFVSAAGGPLVNLALCLVTGLVLAFGFDQSIRPAFNVFNWYPFRIGEGTYQLVQWNGDPTGGSLVVMLFAWTFFINWFLALFNLVLVGIPWDSGSMMRAVLWPYVGYHQATMYMITTGFIIAAIFFMAAFLVELQMLAFLAIFSFLMCRREWLMLESGGEESLFGYDFSAGYTSLEKGGAPESPPRKKLNFIQRYLQRRNARKAQREQDRQIAEERRMDELLEKIQRHGKESLTDEETRFLKRVSDRYRNRN